MSNTTPDGTQKQHWMPNFQRELRKRLVAMRFAEVYTGPDRLITNPYGIDPAGYDGASQTSYSITDFTLGSDSLTVNRRAGAAEHIDNIEQLQTRYDLAMDRSTRHSFVTKDKIDQYVFGLPVAAGSSVQDIDAGYMSSGVSNGTPIASSDSNIENTANAIIERLGLVNGALDRGITWAVSPFELTDISGFTQNNGFNVADAAIKNGFVTDSAFAGLDIVVTNNLTHTQVLGLATNPTADDTITVNGVTFTFKATPANPGEIDIGASADATRALIANALNGSATGQNSATGYFEVSAADRLKLSRLQLTAVNDDTANTPTVTTRGTLIAAEALTDGTDTWATVKRHTIAAVNKSIFLALPEGGGEYERKKVSGKHGEEITTSQVYNGTIWSRNYDEVLDVVMS
jgi:hypothetical protein